MYYYSNFLRFPHRKFTSNVFFAIIHIYSWPYVSPTVRIEYLCYTVLYFLRYACTTKDFSPAYKQKSGIASSVYLISF